MPQIRQTHTYASMEVSEACYQEIRKNFVDLGPDYIYEYIHDYETPDEVLVLGAIGLIKKP